MSEEETTATETQANTETSGAEQTKETTTQTGGDQGTSGKETLVTQGSEKAKSIPDKYELTMPKDTSLSESAIEETVSIAKEQGFSNEQAQALLNEKAKAVDSFVANAEAQAEQWAATSKSDSEVGGAHFDKSCELAKRVVDRFGTDAFKEALNESGLGNHPEVLRFCSRIGRAMSEDTLVTSKAPPEKKKKSVEDTFYPEEKAKE